MKKVLFLLAALVVSVSSMWAQTNYTKKSGASAIHDGIVSGTKYVVDVQVRNNCGAKDKTPLYLMNDAKAYNTDYMVFPSEFVWEIEGTGTGFKLKNVSDSKYFSYVHNNVANMVENLITEFSVDANGYLSPTTSNKVFATGRNLDGEGYPISYWEYNTQNDGYNEAAVFSFYEVEETSDEVASAKAFPEEGTYYMTFTNGDANNRPYIYNTVNDLKYTLQSATRPNPLTNGYVWKVVTDGTKITSMTDGTGQTVGVNGQYNGRLTEGFNIAKQSNGRYYITSAQIKGAKNDHDCLNRSNGGYNNNGQWTVTTWVGANHNDNQWSIDKASFTGDIYDVEVTGAEGAYAIYNGQQALNGGFFFAESITDADVQASTVNGFAATITVVDHKISVKYEAVAAPINVTYHIFVEGVEVGTKIVTEYQDQPTSFTLPTPDYVNEATGIPATASAASVNVYTTYKEGVLPFTPDGTTLYNLELNRNPKLHIYVDGESIKTIATNNANYTEPTYENQANYKWSFGGDWYNGFTIKNAGANKYVTYNSVAPADKTAATLVDEPNTGARFEFRIKNNTQYYFRLHGTTNAAYISDNGGNNPYLTNWNSENNYNQSDAGAQFVFSNAIDIPAGANWTTYETRLNTLKSYTIGTKLGQYADIQDETGDLTLSYQMMMYALDLQLKVEERYESNMAEMQWFLDHMQLNMPQPGTFLRMKGVVNNTNYLLGTKTNDNTKFSMGAAEDATSVFYYDGSHLLSYTTGLYVGTTSSKWQWNLGEGSEINFHDATTKGAYRIQVPMDSGNKPYVFLYSGAANASNADRGAVATIAACTDTKYQWILEEVSELPVAFNEDGQGYATLYAPVALEIPEGVEAYTLHEGEDEYLHANQLTDVIPANTAVVLKGTAGETEDFVVTTGGTVDEENALIGTVPAAAAGEGKYVFSIVGGNAGFYKFGGNDLAGFKAYYVSGNTEVQGFVINFGGMTTGINAAQQAQSQKASFDLQGRRISKATRGLFIQNGQKVIR